MIRSRCYSWSVIKLVKKLMKDTVPNLNKTITNRNGLGFESNILGNSSILKRRFMTSSFSLIDSSVNDTINNDSETSIEVDKEYKRYIPVTPEEVKKIREINSNFIQPSDAKTLKVAVIGSPNAGKSALVNTLMGWKICSVSSKVHTTRANACGICMDGNTQIVLFDTPGIVEMRKGLQHKLDIEMILEPKKCIAEVDLLAVIVDCANKFTCNRIDPEVMQLLKQHQSVEAVLVLNKVDILKSKENILNITHNLTEGTVDGKVFQKVKKIVGAGNNVQNFIKKLKEKNSVASQKDDINCSWPHFKQVFVVSAKTSDGTDKLKEYMLQKAKKESWLCHPNLVTDQSSFSLAEMTVREKFLDQFSDEIPYNLEIKVAEWEVNDFDALEIVMKVCVSRPSLVKVVIGRNGSKIGLVAKEAQKELSSIFRRDVLLKVDVISKKKISKK